MSTFRRYEATCPACEHRWTVEIARGLHITRLPRIPEQLITGRFQVFECPACRSPTVFEATVVYTDFDRHELETRIERTLTRGGTLPLIDLVRAFNLDPRQRATLTLALAVETDTNLPVALRYLANDPALRHVDGRLLSMLVYDSVRARPGSPAICRRARRSCSTACSSSTSRPLATTRSSTAGSAPRRGSSRTSPAAISSSTPSSTASRGWSSSPSQACSPTPPSTPPPRRSASTPSCSSSRASAGSASARCSRPPPRARAADCSSSTRPRSPAAAPPSTNLTKSIDLAFRRRFAYDVQFTFPSVDIRERLWRRAFPARAATQGIRHRELAERFELSGGYVKVAVERAAFLAAGRGEPITMQILIDTVERMYRERGKLSAMGRLE